MTAKKPGARYVRSSVADRIKFYSILESKSGCILWIGATSQGYGYVWNGQKRRRAHIVAYELAKGPVPKGFDLHHRCVNPSCINPDHLEPLTRGDHQRLEPRRWVGDTTHCKRGHEFTPKNTYMTKKGRRSCRACHALWNRLHVPRKGHNLPSA